MPHTISTKQQRRALELAHEGATLQHIIEMLQVNAYQFSCLLIENTTFSDEFVKARSFGYDVLTDQLIGITERIQDPLKARLESENIKWVASRRKPHVYGDKLDLSINQTVDISLALREAKARTLTAPSGPTAEVLDIVEETALLPTGYQPVAASNGVEREENSGLDAPPHASKTALEASPRRSRRAPKGKGVPPSQRAASRAVCAAIKKDRASPSGDDDDIFA